MKSKIPFYLLMAFIIASVLYIIIAPILIVDKIKKDAKKPREQRELVHHHKTSD